MQVPGDAVAVLDEPQLAQLGVEPGVLDRDAGSRGQADDQLLVDVAEHVGRPLVGEVEVAEELVTYPDRHPEERAHRRVTRWEAVAVRVLGEVRAGAGASHPR